MNILVVGGAGYIGSHMVKELLSQGYKVVILDDLSRGHQNLVTGGEFIQGSLGNTALLNKIFSKHSIDAVMHFAAFSIVGESMQQPIMYYRNNVSATADLIGAMLANNVKRFIFSSTAAVYGEPKYTPIDENHPCRPTNPYGETKLAVEKLLKWCDITQGLKYVSLRYFNAAGADDSGAIGERHDPETHLIPLVLKVATGERKEIKIFGTDYDTPDGTCLRDYIHVNDLASAHLLTLQGLMDGKGSAIYNLGNSKGYSVREVIETARKITGCSIPDVESKRRPGDPAVLVASSDKIRSEHCWQPKYEDLETIIHTAWNWHR